MAGTDNPARDVARAYFEAMAAKDVDAIMALTHEDVVCISPLGELTGSEAFRRFSEGFARMIEKLTLVSALGDGADAMIAYSADTFPVKDAYVAEHLVIRDGKIASTRVIYDATPFAAYAAAQQPY